VLVSFIRLIGTTTRCPASNNNGFASAEDSVDAEYVREETAAAAVCGGGGGYVFTLRVVNVSLLVHASRKLSGATKTLNNSP
jgi:hypothetical protein